MCVFFFWGGSNENTAVLLVEDYYVMLLARYDSLQLFFLAEGGEGRVNSDGVLCVFHLLADAAQQFL